MMASTSSESISSLYSFATAALNPGLCIQRATVDVAFLVFGIVTTRFHALFVILDALNPRVDPTRQARIRLLEVPLLRPLLPFPAIGVRARRRIRKDLRPDLDPPTSSQVSYGRRE